MHYRNSRYSSTLKKNQLIYEIIVSNFSVISAVDWRYVLPDSFMQSVYITITP